MLNRCMLLLASLTAGCAINGFDADRMLSIAPSDVPDYDFRVTLANTKGIGFDGDSPNDRLALVGIGLRKQCARIELVSEQAIERGTYGTGRPHVDYVARVRCIRV